MKKNTFLSILLTVLFCFSIASSAAAVEPTSPLWDNIATISANINFDGLTGGAAGSVVSKNGDKISGRLTVYKQTESGDWEVVDSVSESTLAVSLVLMIDFTGESGEYYKTEFMATVIKDGIIETVTKSSYRTCG